MDDEAKPFRFLTKGEKKYLSAPTDEPWTFFRRDMLESPACRALSRAGWLLITRLCIENMNHAGRENGRLAVSFDDFQQFGIDRHAIKRTLEEVTDLGFVRCTMPGQRAYGAYQGRVATYRLTFHGTVGDGAGQPTHDWRQIGDIEATDISRKARTAGRRRKTAKVTPNGYHAEI